MTTRTKIFFDGGCRPNPGPVELAVVVHGIVHLRHDGPVGDHNGAEWLALIWAAELAVAAGLRDVAFIGDSSLIVDQASGRIPCRTAAFAGYRDRFMAVTEGLPRSIVRQVPRTRNLAGIALQRHHDRPYERVLPSRRLD